MSEAITSRWTEIDTLFQAALDLSADERAAFLDRQCVGDRELRAAVDRLLASSDDTAPLLEPGGALIADLGKEAITDMIEVARTGQRIGRWRIVKEIGFGGMAEVYLAERADEQFEQQVALKLIQPDRTSAKSIRRFEQERQIVASLHHPNIAQLLDGGVTEDGRPYFAMEYVEGLPIDRHCDHRRLTLEERLELFLVVVRTVRYAHRNLLVHRDLKPANILVTAEGHVKLIDFGIAKLIDDDVQATRSASFWMTPEYASPEQLNGQPATTATDQYQLGLLLYELMTGRRPFDHVSKTIVEMVLAICEEDPCPPSDAVMAGSGRPGETVEKAAAARRTTPGRLSKSLRGDLDAIILKALSKQPEQRYASTEQLIEEVRCYLAGLPIQVRADSVRYRAAKFIRRHRLGVAAAAAFAALIVGYAATVTVQGRETARERDRAEAEAAKAEQVKAFLVDIFQYADPYEKPIDGEITARQVLDRGAARIENELADQPEAQAELMHLIGKTYGRLGEFGQARPLLAGALEILRELHGPESLEVAQVLNDMATVARDIADYEAAERWNREALNIRRRLLGDEHAKVTGSLHNLAQILEIRGQYEESEELFRQALATDRKVYGGDFFRDVSFDLHSLGELLAKRGRRGEAEDLFLQALAIRRKVLGEMHPWSGSTLRELAKIELARGDFAAAKARLDEALDLHRRVLGADHREVASDLDILGSVYLAEGDLDRAGSTLRQALEIYRGFVGSEHHLSARATAHLADVHRARGDPRQAVDLYQRALTILERYLPDRHPEIATVLVGLGQALIAVGETEAGTARLRTALDIRREVYDPGDPRIAEVEEALLGLVSVTGR
ncbi:MAG: tetratricopeptide repeat protein [Thermoanaerobaculia bacterium]